MRQQHLQHDESVCLISIACLLIFNRTEEKIEQSILINRFQLILRSINYKKNTRELMQEI